MAVDWNLRFATRHLIVPLRIEQLARNLGKNKKSHEVESNVDYFERSYVVELCNIMWSGSCAEK
jgi:hypothetical protein